MAKEIFNKLVLKQRDLIWNGSRPAPQLMSVSPFQFYLEITVKTRDATLNATTHKAFIKVAEEIVKRYEIQINKQVKELVKQVAELRAKDQKGDEKAAKKAGDLIKKAESSFKEAVDDIRIDIRKRIDTEIAKAAGKKVPELFTQQTLTVGRTRFKGIRVARDAFQGDMGGLDPKSEKLVTSVTKEGRGFDGLAKDEKESRDRCMKALATYKSTLQTYLKDYQTGLHRLEQAEGKNKGRKSFAREMHEHSKRQAAAAAQAVASYTKVIGDYQKQAVEGEKDIAKMEKQLKSSKSAALTKQLAPLLKKMKEVYRTLGNRLDTLRARSENVTEMIGLTGAEAATDSLRDWEAPVISLLRAVDTTHEAKALGDLSKKIATAMKKK